MRTFVNLPRQINVKFCPVAGRALAADIAAQDPGHQIIDYIHAQAAAPHTPFCGKEGVVDLLDNFGCHAHAVVGIDNLHPILAPVHIYGHCSLLYSLEAVLKGVHDQVGEHL